MHVVLYEPEIPPNTGNIIRLCANMGANLHLIEPLGFELDDKRMQRAGLDYHELASYALYKTFAQFQQQVMPTRVFAITTKGKRRYTEISYQANDALVFGPETRGLPPSMLEELGFEACLRIPMCRNNRSLNLSNAVAIVAYEAWRQLDFIAGQ